MDEDAGTAPITVLRCGNCGDTFPAEGEVATACPSCGSEDLHPATEPLL